MPRSVAKPSHAAKRSRQAHRLRNLSCAVAQTIVDDTVLAMLIERGFLPNRLDLTQGEVSAACTRFVMEQAGSRKFSRVSEIMRERWHGE